MHDQTVKDEKGRYKRFHGAFTGGFSAGYFNTVGTKEGLFWQLYQSNMSWESAETQRAPIHHAYVKLQDLGIMK